MPYKSKARQRQYQRNWMRQRRLEWLKKNGPCVACGSEENLEVDHVDREQKVTHLVWSWSDERREAELAKCQVLCSECHAHRTWVQTRGERNHCAKLKRVEVEAIHAAYGSGMGQQQIAAEFGVARSTVYNIVNGHRWRHVFEALFPDGHNARGRAA